MSTFEVKTVLIDYIETHPNADLLDLAVIGDYRCVIGRDSMKPGDMVVYIPEASVLPGWLIEEMNLVGRLNGKQKNRVKAVRLRGIVSQGLVLPCRDVAEKGISNAIPFVNDTGRHHQACTLGMDVMNLLTITKYEPPIPTHMSGEIENQFGNTISYDIENFKKFPNVLSEGEDVVVTEKIHGTWACFGYHPEVDHPIITSKGYSGSGLIFKDVPANDKVLYVKAYEATRDESGQSITERVFDSGDFGEGPFYILGEIFGTGVQDLHYGASTPEFRLFDVYVGYPGSGSYMNKEKLSAFADRFGVNVVPILYKGPFSHQKLKELTDGKETVSGNETCIREGIVICPSKERRDVVIGRVQLKSVSDDYLLRKGSTTEFN